MFSHASRIVAVLALILGVFHFVLGVSIAAGWIGPESEALARYAAAPTTGEVIDRSAYIIIFALALGTLAEIGIALRRPRSQ
ncbi:MAG: hypothetical protein JNL14_18415 [Devosia sp.]|jgi:threonine/homoserine/homoserine lactone efflux protein|uniref:hypothetical protein n=1 Tax=Devosia sp. TaxID=1871048 RepID=UPI001A59CC2A|nr:hypothetical protein [Devosia sp.]MBL8599715.1 hypothetical protein [Devosia sp.]